MLEKLKQMNLGDIRKELTIKRMLIGGGAVILAGVLGLVVTFFIVTADLPSVDDLANYEPPITSRVHAGDGKLVAEFANQHRVYVPSEELPQLLIEAFISAEDKSFFENGGVDWWGMVRGTLWNAVRGKRMAGGSTITQQVAKNMLVGSERSAIRKMKELVLAQRMAQKFSKQQILELYMNEIYLGGPSWGVGAASLSYFGKSLGELTLAEDAMLGGLPQRPGEANPYVHPEAAIKRRNYVLDRMAANGYISKADGEKAKAEPLHIVNRLNTDENNAAAYYVEQLRREILKLGQDKKLVGFEDEAAANKGLFEGGFSIRSTLDSNLQLVAQTTLRAGLESYDRRHGWRGPLSNIKMTDQDAAKQLADFANLKDSRAKIAGAGADWILAAVRSADKGGASLMLADGTKGALAAEDAKWTTNAGKKGLQPGDIVLVSHTPTPDLTTQTYNDYSTPKKYAANAPWRLRQIPVVEGALIAMDPHTGRVLAMAGGYSFARSQFNRVVQAMRQPGSSFKPFVYSAALENGYTPSSRVLDAPVVDCSDKTQDKCYKPNNYEGDYFGLATLRFAVEESRNTMTVRLASEMGLNKVSEMGDRMGIYDNLPPYPSMAIGAGETTPLRLVTAYASLVNGGKQVHPVLIDRIQNRYGKTVYKTDERPCDNCLTDWKDGMTPPGLPDQRKQLLDPVIAYQIVSIMEGVIKNPHGTGHSAAVVGKPLAEKTGTTNDQRDAWTMGFSPDLVVGVWTGFDQHTPLGNGETGGRLATPIFRDFMIAALKDQPGLPFRIPQGVRLVEVDHDSGCLPGPETTYPILEAFKPGTEPTERCKAGGEGYKIDFSKASAGDESFAKAPEDQPPADQTPQQPAQPGQGEPALPGQIAQQQPGQPPQQQSPTPQQEGDKIKGGIF